MKLLPLLLMFLFFSGCAVLYPQPKQPVLQDQQAFSLAFEEFQKSHQIEDLQKLKIDFPESIWASRAETIILYAQELDQRKAQNEKLRSSEQRLTSDLEELKKLNLQLTEQIDQLKGLLIQSEKHPK